MGLEELSRRMSKYYETNEKEIEYTPNKAKIPTFNKQSQLPAVNAVSQSNNPPSVQQPRGNALDIAKQVIAKQQPPRQMGVGFTPVPQNPYAKKVSALPYNPAALQKAQTIAQQAQGKTPAQLRQQNLQNINPFNRPAKVGGVGGANAMAGLGQFNKSLAQTADFILPDVITPKFIQNTIDYYKNTGDKLTQNAANVNEEKGVPQWAGQVVQGTVAAVPNAILALMSGGTSLGAQTIGQTSTGLIGSVGTALKELAKNPMFYSSLMQTAGPEYEQAKANGATELEATLTAIIGSIVNAGIEIGGGIEAVAKNPISLKNWVKGMLDEGKEEVLQGIISQAAAKATYDKNKEWVSATDENAVINPLRMGKEFLGGAVVGGVLGGGQMLAGKALGMPTEQDSYLPERGENATAAELAGRLDINDPQPGKLPTITRREQRALDALSQKTGVNIQIDDDIKGSNGYFDRNTNTLHISRNSNNAVYQVAAHEITHSFESNPEEWNQLYEIANANLSEDARSKLEYVLQKTGYTDAEMQSEVVSHYVQQCVTDIKSFEQLVGVNRTLAQRIVDAFETFVRKLTGQRNIGGQMETEYMRTVMGDITPEQAHATLAQMKKALAAGGQTTGEGASMSKKISDTDRLDAITRGDMETSQGKAFNLDDYTIDDILKWSDEEFDRAYKELGLDSWLEMDEDVTMDDNFAIESASESLDIEPETIKILYRRNGLGDSHVEDNRAAVMTQKRIDQRIEEHGAARPDYARRYITRISPKDFIDMTVYEKNMNREEFDSKVRGDFDGKMGDWDYDKQLRDSEEPPVLVIDKSTGQIIGHNGRHRVRALEMAGVESVEIEVELHDEDGYLIKYDAETIPDMAISSQFDTAIETHLSNIIPLNKAHRDEIGKHYGETAHASAGVKYSLKLSDSDYFDAVNPTQDGEVEISSETGTASASYSLKTWNETDKQAVVNDLVKQNGVTPEKAQKWVDDVNGVARIIASDRMLYDYEANPNYTALKKNDEYIRTVDMSTNCKKRILLAGTIDEIQRRLPNTALSGEEYIRIRQMMKDAGYEVSCGFCYVESRRKELGNMAEKFVKQLGDPTVTIADLTTEAGINYLQQYRKDVYDAYVQFNKDRGSGKVNLVESRTEYNGEIMDTNKDRGLTRQAVAKLNRMGGLRAQSYSDFETPHLIDMMQVVVDMSRRGLMSQAYTKVPNFADALGLTGMKINLSLVTSGLDADGNLIFDGVEGMPIEDAMRLRELYSENVGTILVGKDDATILAAMADPRIDFIIPYHRSGWAKAEYEALGLTGYDDYTSWQHERWLVPRKNSSGDIIKRPKSNYYPGEYWDYSKTGKENAEIYLAKCAAEGRIPKFDNFLVNNGDGSWSLQPDGSTDGYWKTLIDFKMYDNNGVGAPQRVVKPEFNPEVLGRIMNEYKGDHRNTQVANDIVEKFLASRLSRKIIGNAVTEQEAKQAIENRRRQLPYAPGYKVANSPEQRTLPKAEELNGEQQNPAQKPVLPANNQGMGIVASPELAAAMQPIVDYTTPKPNPEGNRAFDGSVLDGLGGGQAAFDTLDNLLAQSKVDAAKKPGAKEGIANVLTERPKKGVKENLEIAADFAARKLVDSGHTINTIAKAVDDKVLYPLYNNAKQSRQAAEYMIGDAQTDINGKRVGDSLVSIFDPIKSKGEDYFRDFSTYLYHVHNVDRMSLETNGAQVYQDAIMQLEMESPMLQNATREEVEALASGNSDYREAAIEWLQLDDSLNDLHNKPVFGESVTAEDSSKAASELLRKNPEFRELAEKVYAYNRNLMKYRVDAGLVSQKQADIMNTLYPHYVPTFRDTSSTTGMKMGGNQATVARTVRSATGSNLDLMPIDGSMAEQTLQTVRAAKTNIFGARLLEDALKHQDKVGRHIRSVVDKYNSYDMDEPPQYTGGVTIYSAGKPVSMDADVGVMEAFKSIQPDPLEGSNIYRRIVEANNTFKALVTGANPMFLAKNFARDLQDAGLYAGDLKDFAKNYPKAWKEIKNNGELWQLYKSQGGTGSSYFDYEKGLVDNKRKGVGKVFDKVEAANMMVEQAPRFAEFMSVLEKEGRTYEGIQKAMLAAADVTVNFGRSGTLTKTLNKTFVPFLNPSVQGADKFVRRFAQTKGAKEWFDLIGRCALLGIVPGLLNELLHRGTEEEEEYEMLNDRDKETNYVFSIGDGVWVKIPRGRAVSIFGSAAQRTARTLQGKEDAWAGFIELALDQVGTTDPFTGHILSSYLNTDLFNPESPGKTWYGGDIEPQRLQGLPPGERYDEKTDNLSKWLGKQLNISPKKINHLLDSYTGVIGDFALPLMTPRAERNPFAAAFSIDSTTSNKLQGEFYDKLDELEQGKNSAEPTAGADLAYSYLNGVSREVSELNKQIRAIEADETIKDKDKREQTRKLAEERNNLIKEALEELPSYQEAAAGYNGDPEDAKREVNRKQFGAEYALKKYNKEVYENAQKANKYLIPYETFYDVYFAQKDLKSDKDSDGKTIKNSLSKKKKAAIDKAAKSLTQKQKEYLYDMFGVSKSEWNKLPTKT